MKAMKLIRAGEPLELHEDRKPEPGDGGTVLVKVEVCGVCHTDIHLNAGFYDLGEGRKLTLRDRGIELPRTLGHEIAGRVEEVGEKIESSLRPGDSVAVYPWIGCGSCRNCLNGLDNMCEGRPRSLGIFTDGGYSEFVLVPEARFLVPLEGVAMVQAAPLSCSGITSLSALRKTRLRTNDTLLVVIGAGGLGNTAIQLAKKTRGARVAVLDVRDAQLELASKVGADHVLNTRGMTAEVISKAVKGFNDGRGVDDVIDFVGSSETFVSAFQMMAKGGRLVSVGLFGGSAQVPLPVLAQRGIEIVGNYTGTLADLSELVELVRKGTISPVVSEVMRLEDVNLALDRLRNGDVGGRILVGPGSS